MDAKEFDLIIIGAGPAGCSAAVYGKRGGLNLLMLGGAYPGGQLLLTNEVENYPGFEIISGAEIIDKMHKQLSRLGVEITKEDVAKIEKNDNHFIVTSKNGSVYKALAVIAATGARARWLGAPGESKYRGKGVSACATCDGFFFRGKEVCVVGGGNTALEDALFLTHFAPKVHLIHRREGFRAEAATVQKVKENPKIQIHVNFVVDEILGDGEAVTGIRIKSVKEENKSENIDCKGVFIAVGYVPVTDVFKNAGVDLYDDGHIKTDARSRTNIRGLYAAGDCADPLYHQAIVAAGSGAKAAIEAVNFVNLCK